MYFDESELECIDAESESVFESFYWYLLNDPFLQRFFGSQEQLKALAKKQQESIQAASRESRELLEERFYRLGKMHFDYGIPLWEVIKGFDFLRDRYVATSVQKRGRDSSFENYMSFFDDVRQFFCRGYFENECIELVNEYKKELYENAYHLVHSKWLIKMMEYFIKSSHDKIPIQEYENRVFSQLLQLPETNMLFKSSQELDDLIFLNAHLTSYAKNILHHVRSGLYLEANQILQVFKNSSSNLVHLIDKTVVSKFKSKEDSFLGYVSSKLDTELKVGHICVLNVKKLNLINKYQGSDVGDYVIHEMGSRIKGFIVGLDEDVVFSASSNGEFYIFMPLFDSEYCLSIIRALIMYISNEKICYKEYEFFVQLHSAMMKLEQKGMIEYIEKLLRFALSRSKDRCEQPYFLNRDEQESALNLIKKSNENILSVHRAIIKEGIELFFQPIIEISSGEIFDVEVLVRIKNENSYISAGEFINLIHELDIIIDMDMKVLDKILLYQETLRKVVSYLFINISPSSLKSPKYFDKLVYTVNELKKTGLVAYLEITEQSFLENIELITQIHEECGVKFAVDDFGTGYSSLKTVAELAEKRIIDFIKIDGSIVKNSLDSKEIYQVLDATAYMTKKLNLKNIAEFVEDEKILEVVKNAGIEYAQGYLFSKPMHLDELIARYQKR